MKMRVQHEKTAKSIYLVNTFMYAPNARMNVGLVCHTNLNFSKNFHPFSPKLCRTVRFFPFFSTLPFRLELGNVGTRIHFF